MRQVIVETEPKTKIRKRFVMSYAEARDPKEQISEVKMEIFESIYVTVVFVLGMFLAIGIYILQRDKYWRRVWRELGEPQVESVEMLRELIKERAHSTSHAGSDSLARTVRND